MEMVEIWSNSDDIAATLDKIAAKIDAIGSFKEDIAFLERLAVSREKAHSGEHRSEEKEDLDGDGSGCTNSDITSEANTCDNFCIYDFKDGTSDDVKKIVSTLNAGHVSSTDVVEVVVSSPFVFLPYVKSELQPEFQVAAQNCWVEKGGAFTDGVSAEMLVNLGIPWVILCHSERRALLNETNEFVGDKVAYALSQCLKVIACVGEALEQREAGTTMEVVTAQTKVIADKFSSWDNVVIYPTPPWIVFIDFDLRTSRFTKEEVLILFQCKCIPAERKGIQVTNIWEVCWLKLGQSCSPRDPYIPEYDWKLWIVEQLG